MSVMHSNQSPTPSLRVGIVPPYNNNKFTIMERNLKFLKTMSVAEFKAQHNVEKIEVKRNEHTGKCFFVYGFETGACSRKVETGELTSVTSERGRRGYYIGNFIGTNKNAPEGQLD